MQTKLCLDPTSYRMKPKDKQEISRISNRIASHQTIESTDKIADLVGNHGHAMTPAIFKEGKRKTEYFDEMQMFVLDFDKGISYGSIKGMCMELGLPIHFSYYTFSSTEEIPKFRVIFCHMVPIREKWLAEIILGMLKTLFPMADQACFDVARMFFGGKGVIEINQEAIFRVDELIKGYQVFLYKTDKANYKRNIQRFASKYGLDVLDGGILNVDTYMCGEMDEKKGNPIKGIIELPQISSKIVFYGSQGDGRVHHHNVCKEMPGLEKISRDALCSRCQLSKEFLEGKELPHDARFLLATNFLQIKGGRKLFLEAIRQYYGDSYDKWEFDWKYIRAKGYRPMACEGGCPYAESCSHDINLCLTLKGRRGIRKLETDETYQDIEDCYRYMEDALKQVVKYPREGIHLIKGQTGLGKSTAYKRLMKEVKVPMLIAVPTVKLKNEIARDVGDIALEALSIQDLYMPVDLADRVKELYDRGLYKEAKKEIGNYAKQLPDGIEKMRYQKYFQLQKAVKKKDRHIIMTHAQLFQMKDYQLEGYRIVVDEDILFSMLRNTKSVSLHDIRACLGHRLAADATAQLERLLNMADDSYMRSDRTGNTVYIKKEILDEAGINGNINELFNAGSYYCTGDEIQYYVPSRLPGKTIIVMSATLDEELYRLYFKSRKIYVYDTPKARYKGRVIQYTYHSMSRDKMKELGKEMGSEGKLIEFIQSLAPTAEYEISFKKYDDAHLLRGGLHFGNASGIDQYKGKDGLILGTPHLCESSYKLVASYLGIETDGERATICRRKVCYKGYEFNMMTYEDEDIRRIQLYMISSELEQCIGRSRLLREEATVYVFSNFPCEQAELIQTDYLKEGFEKERQDDIPVEDISSLEKSA